jgi:ABC-type multidrug transport system ATPase subunit
VNELSFSEGSTNRDWQSDFLRRIKAGHIYGILGLDRARRSSYLRHLAGFDSSPGKKKSGEFYFELSGIAYLPPPGEEIFIGTTAGEELEIYWKTGNRDKKDCYKILEQFGLLNFRSLEFRSVWDLSDSEKRLLLIAVQALAEPSLWICDEPLGLLDGKNAAKVCGLLRKQARNGAVVVIASEDAGSLLDLADQVLFLSEEGVTIYCGEVNDLPHSLALTLGWDSKLRKASAEAADQEGKNSCLDF